jgi:hypothetical protein
MDTADSSVAIAAGLDRGAIINAADKQHEWATIVRLDGLEAWRPARRPST